MIYEQLVMEVIDMNLEEVKKIKLKHEMKLMKKANVIGVMTAQKIQNGVITSTLGITCMVRDKVAPQKLRTKDIIPKEIDGVFTDVIEVGRVKALGTGGLMRPRIGDSGIDRKTRLRPAPMGTSGGHYSITAGTNGELLMVDGNLCIGTNNHVAAMSNEAKIGDDYLQPGPHDGGKKPDDVIGNLYKFQEITFVDAPSSCQFAGAITTVCNLISAALGRKTRLSAFYSKNISNLVDAAAVKVISAEYVLSKILDIGRPKGVGEAHIDAVVQKSGRTTEHTKNASVTAVDATINVSYGEGKMAIFTNQILISQPGFSAGGDSGSLVLNMSGYAVGKLFAGSDQVTIANHMRDYLDALDAELVVEK